MKPLDLTTSNSQQPAPQRQEGANEAVGVTPVTQEASPILTATTRQEMSATSSSLANAAPLPSKSLLVKITPPQARRVLTRPRVLSLMEEGSKGYNVTIVSANSGFGKTTALVDFVHHANLPLAWYSLDDEDKDPAVFCRYLLDSVRILFPDFGLPFEELLSYNLQQLHQNPSLILRMADEFISNLEGLLAKLKKERQAFGVSANTKTLQDENSREEIGSTYYKPYLLDEYATEFLFVLDDYQFAECPALDEFMERLIRRMPHGLHLIIASRQLPSNLPISTLLNKQMLFMIEAKDLAFTAREIHELLKQFYSIDEPQLGEALVTYSEGWVTAVILALQNREITRRKGVDWHLSGRSDTASIENSISIGQPVDFEQLFTYLAQEVFQNLSNELRSFLLQTGVFSELTIESSAQVLDLSVLTREELLSQLTLNRNPATLDFLQVPSSNYKQAQLLLQQLESRNLFLEKSKAGNQAPAWRYHALFKQFLQAQLEQTPEVFSQKIHLIASLISNISGQTPDLITHLIAAGEVSLAADWLNNSVEGFYESGKINLISSLLSAIPAKYQNLPRLTEVTARLMLAEGNNVAALEGYDKAAKLYHNDNSQDLEAKALAQQAQILLRIGNRQEAKSVCSWIIRQSSKLLVTSHGRQALGLANYVLATLAIEKSDTSQAETRLKEAIQIFNVDNDQYRLATIDSSFGQLYYNEGRIVKSNVYYQKALDYFVKVGNSHKEAYSRLSMAINKYTQNLYQQAEDQLNETLDLIVKGDIKDSYLRVFILAHLGNVYRETGRHNKANEVYDEALLLARHDKVHKEEITLLTDKALNYILQARKIEARELIALSLVLCEDYELPERLGLIYLTQAWYYYETRSYKQALNVSEQAVSSFQLNTNKNNTAKALLCQSVIWLASGEPRKSLSILNTSFNEVDELGYEPFSAFELSFANGLFEYASKKKISVSIKNFLIRRGYLQPELDRTPTQTTTSSHLTFIKNNLLSNDFDDSSDKNNVIEFSKPPQRSSKNEFLTEVAPTKDKRKSAETSFTQIKVYALNGGKVFLANQEIEQWHRNKSRELFFYLLEFGSCTRDQLLEALWSDENWDSNQLHVTITKLRKIIVPIEVKLNSGSYSLQGSIWYDVTEFSQHLKTLLYQPSINLAQANQLEQILALYKRDYLDQIYSNWAQERQQQLQQLYLDGVQLLAQFYQDNSDFKLAQHYWQQFLIKDQYNEEVYRKCIVCLLNLGNNAEARRQSLNCIKALQELDLQPSKETQTLIRKLA